MGLGYVEGATRDYKRHRMTTLLAALIVLNGAVLAACEPHHRHQEFLYLLREIDKAVPAELDIHCIADNHDTPTTTQRSSRGWQRARAGTCTSSRRTAPGSIRSSASSP